MSQPASNVQNACYCASRLQTAILFGLLLALQFSVAALTPAWAGGSLGGAGDVSSTVILGAAMAWPAMFALWAVFGSQCAAVRLPLTLWLTAVGALCLTFGIQQNDGERLLFQGQLAAAAWPLAFAALQAPLWLLRAIRRWRLERFAVSAATATDSIAFARAKATSQFSLRGLLGWISAIAMTLAAFRAMAPKANPELELNLESLLTALQDAETGPISLVVALGGLPIIALAWIVLADGRRMALRLVLGFVVLPVLVGGFGLFCSEMNAEFIAINGISFEEASAWEAGALLNGLVCLGAVRVSGYRLRRNPKKTAENPDPAGAMPACISRLRFAVAAAPLVVALAGLASIVPERVEERRRADIQTDWLRGGLFPSFADDGTIVEIESLQPITDEACQRIASVGNLVELDLGRSIGDFEAMITGRQLALLAPLSRLQHLGRK